jgi:hypothetical protein
VKKYWVILLVVGSVFSYQNLFAQTAANKGDYLVSNSGDTLYGKFKKKLFDQATFIVNGETIALDPTQYAAYSFKNTLFRSIQLSPQANPQWMQCLENGEICLYQYLMLDNVRPRQTPVNRVIWLAQKGNGALLNVNGVMASQDIAKNNLINLFTDEPAVLHAFKLSAFTLKNIRYFIQQYNLSK